MIFRSRTHFIPDGTWAVRATSATAKAKLEQGNHEVSQAVYAAEVVKQALEQLFLGKCCYCESRIGVVADWDVEHFRPKGKVSERPEHPGYYWLAYDWENLLPSCSYCNQARKDRATAMEAEGPSEGKLDQFPLLDEALRCMDHHGDLALEQPLMINPTLEDPEIHIGFMPDGKAFGLSERGARTIDICHLNRKRLRDERLGKMAGVLELVNLLTRVDDHLSAQIRDSLVSTAADDKVHSAVVRAVLRNPERF
jgi:uncharacterized protein (TIGR02646 family)